MFILTTISDVIQIEPSDFSKPSRQAIEDNINQKYANRVIEHIGLCICFYDLSYASDGLIGSGSGIVNVSVDFRIIVFRPFKGEIIEGTITDSTANDVKIELKFFGTISVPGPISLFEPSNFNASENTWVWTNDTESYYFDRGERVRLRVEAETWHDPAPVEPPKMIEENGLRAFEDEKKAKRPLWEITASMAQGGLGVLSWW